MPKGIIQLTAKERKQYSINNYDYIKEILDCAINKTPILFTTPTQPALNKSLLLTNIVLPSGTEVRFLLKKIHQLED